MTTRKASEQAEPVTSHGYEVDSNILVELHCRVGHNANRPDALNALTAGLMHEVAAAAAAMDVDRNIGAIVIAGSDRAFAAGADIKEMADKIYSADWTRGWEDLRRLRIPIIPAVSGPALGGGFELAMMADFIIAGDNARFGQPEINLGVIPGMGGSQRLTRAIGKAKAMDLILTGRLMDADETERSGLVSRVVPASEVISEALRAAEVIAAKSTPVAMIAKELVNAAFEVNLAQGIQFERRMFQSLFGVEDRKEGMAAFIQKRQPGFVGR